MLLDKLNLSRTHMSSVIDQHIYQAERCSRRSCLRISSVPEIPEEWTDYIVLKIACTCNVSLSISDIDRSHKTLKRPCDAAKTKFRPSDIIVKFVWYRSKKFFNKGKYLLEDTGAYRGVDINEDLTRQRAYLVQNARLFVLEKTPFDTWSCILLSHLSLFNTLIDPVARFN